MADGAWGYAQGREIREGTRELPRVDDDERDEAAWEAAFEREFDRYAEWVGKGRPEGGF